MGDTNDLSLKPLSLDTDPEHLSDDPKWTSGDFTLVSADGVRFRVQSCFILAASAVFRNAGDLSGGSEKVVRFSDSRCETASTLRDFLALATTAQLEPQWPTYGLVELCEHISAVVDFMRKYECDGVLRSLLLAFHYDLLLDGGRDYALEALVLGAVADDVDYCKKAIRASRWKEGSAVNDAKTDPLTESRRGCFPLVPSNMPLQVYELLPTGYAWALSRSWAVARENTLAWPHHFGSMVDISKSGR
ncbi:hypothetical protein Q8F55_002729 [Vanrija albida]|uniref:BTB domain-containing protein n=1 Tax=Vanrija albida TaxID=181172 RepID=A0ABR3QAT0_9TREE